MRNNSQTRNKSKYLTNIGFRFLLLCILLTSHLPKISAEDGFMLLQSTDVTLNLTNVSLETLFKTLEKKSNYVFFFKEDVLQKNEKVTVKAQNESVVSILNRILSPSTTDIYSKRETSDYCPPSPKRRKESRSTGRNQRIYCKRNSG